MKSPYTPKALVDSNQKNLDDYYARHGVETEIVLEEKGYALKVYVKDVCIGGLMQLEHYKLGT